MNRTVEDYLACLTGHEALEDPFILVIHLSTEFLHRLSIHLEKGSRPSVRRHSGTDE